MSSLPHSPGAGPHCLPLLGKTPVFESGSKAVTDAVFGEKCQESAVRLGSRRAGDPSEARLFHGTGGQSLLHTAAPSPEDQPLVCTWIPGRGRRGGEGRGHGARNPSRGANLLLEGRAIGDRYTQTYHLAAGEMTLASFLCLLPPPPSSASLLSAPLAPQQESVGSGMCSAKRAKLASRTISSKLQKGNTDANSTPSISPGPKPRHFLLACKALINSRQKVLVRELFGKCKGRGRDGCWPPRPVALYLPLSATSLCHRMGPFSGSLFALAMGCTPSPAQGLPKPGC